MAEWFIVGLITIVCMWLFGPYLGLPLGLVAGVAFIIWLDRNGAP